jgi:catechol 2,3-dioxygenase-like lactoylglutathione lyase family enzyme
MLDHVSMQCEDPAASAAFYDAVLAAYAAEVAQVSKERR